MVGWLRSIFGGRRPTPPFGGVVGVTASDNVARRALILDDAKHIEAALTDLANVGIKLHPTGKTNLAAAEEIAAHWHQGVVFTLRERTSGDWALLALSAESESFENSIVVQDHCFDVAQPGDYAQTISEIAALAGDQWRIQSVDVKNMRHPGAKQPVTVTMKAEP